MMGLRSIKQPKSRVPLAERQIAIAKRAVGAPALQRLNGASYRYRPGENLLVLEINEFPETAPVALPSA